MNASAHAVDFMHREITHICRDMESRAPGSRGERAAARYMADVLKNQCGCVDVKEETFSEHPSAFWGYFWFSMTFDVLCAVFSFFAPLLSVISGGIAMFLFVVQFLMYKQLIDPLFPKTESINITAVRACSDTPRRRILFNGHSDAAWEFPLNYHFGGVVFEIPGVLALVGVLYYMVLSASALSGWNGMRPYAFAGLIFVPFFVLVAFTYNPKRVVDGANDNLSGCYIGIAILRELEKNGIILENTEVGVIITGSEEAGLRGAKAWAAVHQDDYKDVPTMIISYDTIHDPWQLMVNARDLNGTVASDRVLCDLFLNAAEQAGVPCKKGWVPPFGGATDSAAFTQGGFRSIGVTGLNHKLEDYYHTRKDDCDNLDFIGLENCYKATVSALNAIDLGYADER